LSDDQSDDQESEFPDSFPLYNAIAALVDGVVATGRAAFYGDESQATCAETPNADDSSHSIDMLQSLPSALQEGIQELGSSSDSDSTKDSVDEIKVSPPF
jgi:hypothetical protein